MSIAKSLADSSRRQCHHHRSVHHFIIFVYRDIANFQRFSQKLFSSIDWITFRFPYTYKIHSGKISMITTIIKIKFSLSFSCTNVTWTEGDGHPTFEIRMDQVQRYAALLYDGRNYSMRRIARLCEFFHWSSSTHRNPWGIWTEALGISSGEFWYFSSIVSQLIKIILASNHAMARTLHLSSTPTRLWSDDASHLGGNAKEGYSQGREDGQGCAEASLRLSILLLSPNDGEIPQSCETSGWRSRFTCWWSIKCVLSHCCCNSIDHE